MVQYSWSFRRGESKILSWSTSALGVDGIGIMKQFGSLLSGIILVCMLQIGKCSCSSGQSWASIEVHWFCGLLLESNGWVGEFWVQRDGGSLLSGAFISKVATPCTYHKPSVRAIVAPPQPQQRSPASSGSVSPETQAISKWFNEVNDELQLIGWC
jgi:hypothetical protein